MEISSTNKSGRINSMKLVLWSRQRELRRIYAIFSMDGPSFDPTETTGRCLVDPPRQTRQIVTEPKWLRYSVI